MLLAQFARSHLLFISLLGGRHWWPNVRKIQKTTYDYYEDFTFRPNNLFA